MPTIESKLSTFEGLSRQEIFQIFKLRVDVFVVEQKCYYPEIDDWDVHPDTQHLLFLDGKSLAGYARLLPPTPDNSGTCAIGRVIVANAYRGHDLGQRLMQQAIGESLRFWPNSTIKISAQLHLQKFYGQVGFKISSEAYLEDGIPHIDMTYNSVE